jgi:hypothetical protein
MAITGGSRDQAVAWNGLTYSAASSPAAKAPVVMARTAMTSTASRGSQFLLFLILFPSILQLGPAQPNFAQTKTMSADAPMAKPDAFSARKSAGRRPLDSAPQFVTVREIFSHGPGAPPRQAEVPSAVFPLLRSGYLALLRGTHEHRASILYSVELFIILSRNRSSVKAFRQSERRSFLEWSRVCSSPGCFLLVCFFAGWGRIPLKHNREEVRSCGDG